MVNHLKEDTDCFATMMVDYYGLPDDWPGRLQSNALAYSQKADTVQGALLADISQQMGANFNPDRFVPYVMMHEFEAMLFSDCERFSLRNWTSRARSQLSRGPRRVCKSGRD